MKYILITGANGMIANSVIIKLLNNEVKVLGLDCTDSKIYNKNYTHETIDLTQCLEVEKILGKYDISHIIHFAAIAHKISNLDFSWNRYYRINVLCSKTIFEYANTKNVPVFFASTADVYGITCSFVNSNTRCNPIGEYAKSKFLAERSLESICVKTNYVIARFAPVYTSSNQFDIRKRYYLKYPNFCYVIGNGIKYEFASIDIVTNVVLEWIKTPIGKKIINVCDNAMVNTKEKIKNEKIYGRAKYVFRIPIGFLKIINILIQCIFGKNSYEAFLVAKLINPIKYERKDAAVI